MCGIFGAIGLKEKISSPDFDLMLRTLAPRGPDGCGDVRCDENCRLGHMRLAIMDTSAAGNQPLKNEAGDIWCVVNGEIYNYPQLRKELEGLGHRFSSGSDSETVLHAYEQWGEKSVERFRGIFAFVLYDSRKKKLFGARDSIGAKPLYYWKDGQTLWFASELKALVRHSRFAKKIDREAMYDYLAYRYVPFDKTIYKSAKKIPAAHAFVFERGRMRSWRYWRPKIQKQSPSADAISEIVRESVKAQLMSDVPVGVLLSGGIDSSTVAALTALEGHRLKAFTCGFEEEGFDERPYARIAAKEIGLELHECVMTCERLLEGLPAYIDWFDEPFFDYSAVAIHDLCRLARQKGVKVLLAGDGADELFAGYRWYDDYASADAKTYWAKVKAEMMYFEGTRRRGLGKRLPWVREDWFFRKFDKVELPFVTRAQYLDFHTFMVDDVLTKVDRASMAAGIEVRVPLLDQRLLDEAFLLPQADLYAGGERKALFKKALAKFLSGDVLTRRKKGFGFPLENWREKICAVARPLLEEGRLLDYGFITPEGVKSVFETMDMRYVWLIFTAELWLRRSVCGEDLDQLLKTKNK